MDNDGDDDDDDGDDDEDDDDDGDDDTNNHTNIILIRVIIQIQTTMIIDSCLAQGLSQHVAAVHLRPPARPARRFCQGREGLLH
eukprot:3073175-Heterocapsa_arctica.AAC.1